MMMMMSDDINVENSNNEDSNDDDDVSVSSSTIFGGGRVHRTIPGYSQSNDHALPFSSIEETLTTRDCTQRGFFECFKDNDYLHIYIKQFGL